MRFRWAYTRLSPGDVPQCPSSRGLMCSGSQRLAQERVVLQKDLADRQIVRRRPVAVNLPELLVPESGTGGGARRAIGLELRIAWR